MKPSACFEKSIWCPLWTTAVIVAVAAAGCSARQQTEPESPEPEPAAGRMVLPFFPLEVGNQWHYSGRHLGQEITHDIEIVARDGYWYVDSEGERFQIDREGLRSPERYLLRAPIRKGAEWKSVVSLSATEHYEIADVGVAASVPAGTFQGCVRVVARVRVDPTITLFKEDTYCPRVGLVRIRTWLDAARKGQIPQGELELTSYQLTEGDG